MTQPAPEFEAHAARLRAAYPAAPYGTVSRFAHVRGRAQALKRVTQGVAQNGNVGHATCNGSAITSGVIDTRPPA